MPPALNHRKSRKGCTRCKIRKVKCDEAKPACTACARHKVQCEYFGAAAAAARQEEEGPSGDTPFALQQTPAFELRLMHEWTAHVSETLTTAYQFWRYEAPVLGLEHRHVLDGMFALAALRLSRAHLPAWASRRELAITERWTFGAQQQEGATARTTTDVREDGRAASTSDMTSPAVVIEAWRLREHSRNYFAAAVAGHQRAVSNLEEADVKVAFVGATLISVYSLFGLSEDDAGNHELAADALQWAAISRGVQPIVSQWAQLRRSEWVSKVGTMYGKPDLSNATELFREEHRSSFKFLLEPVAGDILSDEDCKVYEDTLSYIGLIHKGVGFCLDEPLATMRRIIAMPARVPPRFVDLIAEKAPRAIAVLAHFFGIVKLAEEKNPWLHGIAQRQVLMLCAKLEGPWTKFNAWPLRMVREETAGPGT